MTSSCNHVPERACASLNLTSHLCSSCWTISLYRRSFSSITTDSLLSRGFEDCWKKLHWRGRLRVVMHSSNTSAEFHLEVQLRVFPHRLLQAIRQCSCRILNAYMQATSPSAQCFYQQPEGKLIGRHKHLRFTVQHCAARNGRWKACHRNSE